MSNNSKTIFKIEKRERPFVQIDKNVIDDKSISWKAKGILIYLLSKPNDWQVYETEIQKHATDGRSSVRSGIQELIEAGYIDRYQRRSEKGKFQGYEYRVFEEPNRVRFSDNGKTDNGKADTTNKEVTNKEVTNTTMVRSETSDYVGVVNISFNQYIKDYKPIIDDVTKSHMEYFLRTYRETMDRPHPRLTVEQWEDVSETLNEVEDHSGHVIELAGYEMKFMIDKYFQTHFEDCNYSILHFNSGGVKAIRYYEVIDEHI